MFLPTHVRKEQLVDARSAQSKVLKITYPTYPSTATAKTGTQYVRTEMKKSDPVSNFLFIEGQRQPALLTGGAHPSQLHDRVLRAVRSLLACHERLHVRLQSMWRFPCDLGLRGSTIHSSMAAGMASSKFPGLCSARCSDSPSSSRPARETQSLNHRTADRPRFHLRTRRG